MTIYFNSENVDDRIIAKATDVLNNNGLIAYPTDSSWGIGCSSKSKQAIDKLRKIKGEMKEFPITIMCSSISQITTMAEVSNRDFKIIKKYTPGPFVFILKALYNIEKIINVKRAEVGIRIPPTQLLTRIIDELGVPIFSITASKKMISPDLYEDFYKEECLFSYGYELEDIRPLDLILDSGEELPRLSTTVISLLDDDILIVRQGEGVI